MHLQHIGPFAVARSRVWCQHCFRAASTRVDLDAVSCAYSGTDLARGFGPTWCARCGTPTGTGIYSSTDTSCPQCERMFANVAD